MASIKLELRSEVLQRVCAIPSTCVVNGNVGRCSAYFPVVDTSSSSSFTSSWSLSWSVRQECRVSGMKLLRCDNWRRDGRRHSLALRATANAEDIETPALAAASTPASIEDIKLSRRAADWKKAEKLKETGEVHRALVEGCNSGGLLVQIGSLQGFLPFSQLNGPRLLKDGSKTIGEVGNELIGEVISVKVIEVVEAERRLIVSEKQAALVDILQQIEVGSVYTGKVNFVTDYGAFVDLEFPDGKYLFSGLVHVTELSWDPIPFPRDFIAQGDQVRVKVIQVDREKSKVSLSIKQLQADPLLETLDTLMPVQGVEGDMESRKSDAELNATPLPGLQEICEYMLQEEGISEVTLGRQALERRVVSQDLELWLSNACVEDGKFTLLARAGRQVQEVQLNTTLDREGIKAAVQRVTGRVP